MKKKKKNILNAPIPPPHQTIPYIGQIVVIHPLEQIPLIWTNLWQTLFDKFTCHIFDHTRTLGDTLNENTSNIKQYTQSAF